MNKRLIRNQSSKERLTDARIRLARARGDERFVLIAKDDRFRGFDHQLSIDVREEN